MNIFRHLFEKKGTGPGESSWVRVPLPTHPSTLHVSNLELPSLQKPADSESKDLADAEILSKDFKWSEAIKLYDKVITNDPKNARALFGRASCYEWKDDFAGALRDIEAALLIDKMNADYLHLRSLVYADMKHYELAITDASKALELHPNNYDSYYIRGRSYFELKQYDKALADFQKCKQIQPNTLNPDDFLKKIKIIQSPHFEPVYAETSTYATQVLINKALCLILIISMETVQEQYKILQEDWASKVLVTGTLKHIEEIVFWNLNIYAPRRDFEKFRIEVDSGDDFAQVSAFFHSSFIGIRVWRCKKCYCACGNADFVAW